MSSAAAMAAKTNSKGRIRAIVGKAHPLMPKIDTLQAIVKANEYDIVGINESWLHRNERNCPAEIGIQGFTTFNVD